MLFLRSTMFELGELVKNQLCFVQSHCYTFFSYYLLWASTSMEAYATSRTKKKKEKHTKKQTLPTPPPPPRKKNLNTSPPSSPQPPPPNKKEDNWRA